MKKHVSLVIFLICLGISISSYASWTVLYETTFSTDPFITDSWITNNSSHYYWDSSNQALYTDNYTNSGEWATREINYNGEAFRLQFDIKPISQPSGSGDIDFGLFTSERKAHNTYGDSTERIFGFLGGYSSGTQMYGEGATTTGNQLWLYPPTPQSMEFDKWYHYYILYDGVNVTLEVSKEGTPLFSTSVAAPGGFSSSLDYVGASMNGTWITSDRREIALVDNVKMEVNPSMVPEPTSLMLLGLGLFALLRKVSLSKSS